MKIRFLRWVLEFANGRKIEGAWGKSRYEGECAKINKTGLLYAVIQEKRGCVVREVVRCKGEDFCMFSWGARAMLTPIGAVLCRKQVNIMNTELILHSRKGNYVASMYEQDYTEKTDNSNNTSLHYCRENFGNGGAEKCQQQRLQ